MAGMSAAERMSYFALPVNNIRHIAVKLRLAFDLVRWTRPANRCTGNYLLDSKPRPSLDAEHVQLKLKSKLFTNAEYVVQKWA